MTKNTSRILVALDNVGIFKNAMRLAEELAPYVAGFKLNDALDVGGITMCAAMKQFGEVMADAKLHDIPNTMRNRTQVYAHAECTYLTVHAGNTIEALVAAQEAAGKTLLLGVTVLTSVDEGECAEIYYDRGHRGFTINSRGSHIEQKVLEFASRTRKAQLAGMVCSPKELGLVNQSENKALLKVIPGVRSPGASAHDQKRVMTPAEAVLAGAYRIVVGREILEAKDPANAAKRINDDVDKALANAA